MSSAGLNKWTVSGNLAADALVKTVDLRTGQQIKVANGTIYVRGVKNRNESFMVRLSIWEGTPAWRTLSFLKKGSLIICTGSVEPAPYVSKTDGSAKAGLTMKVLDIDLDVVRDSENTTDYNNQTAGNKTPVAV
ncbi:MAG: single-stranded DNA-binding protein [Symploca sp. SIO2G7]|nr:single-stranded DNA-binding protein [Symploca sp. SIO2G7]